MTKSQLLPATLTAVPAEAALWLEGQANDLGISDDSVRLDGNKVHWQVPGAPARWRYQTLTFNQDGSVYCSALRTTFRDLEHWKTVRIQLNVLEQDWANQDIL